MTSHFLPNLGKIATSLYTIIAGDSQTHIISNLGLGRRLSTTIYVGLGTPISHACRASFYAQFLCKHSAVPCRGKNSVCAVRMAPILGSVLIFKQARQHMLVRFYSFQHTLLHFCYGSINLQLVESFRYTIVQSLLFRLVQSFLVGINQFTIG